MESNEYVLCLTTDNEGQIFLHGDAAGLDMLINTLQRIRKGIDKNDCPHDHLFSASWTSEECAVLTQKMKLEPNEKLCHHLKIYGWTDEWAKKHSLK